MSAQPLWYQNENEEESASAMVNAARALWSDQGDQRRRDADDAMTLWSGTTAHGFSGSNAMSILGLVEGTAGYNVVQSVTDTKVNTTLRNEIRPLLMCNGGDSELRDKAEAMQDAADGQSYELGLDDELEEVACWNGYIFGNGGVEFWADTASSRIMASPVFHWQYFVSRQESRYTTRPSQLFARHVMPRDVLLSFMADQSSEARKAIEDAPSASWNDARDFVSNEPGTVVDLVVIWKAWHLPSKRVDLSDPRAFGKGESGRSVRANHDGLHMVCIEGANTRTSLLTRPWPHAYFPIAWFKPNRNPGSYWGRGEPEILARSQVEMNQWSEREYNVLDRYANPSVILPKGAKLNPGQINNSGFNIYQIEGGSGNAPFVWTPNAVPADLINRRGRLAAEVKDQRGMSDMSMAARKPAGVDHKPGMAYLANTETIRHTAEFRAWRRFKLDSYRNIIRCFKELSEHDPNFEVVYEKDKQLVTAKMTSIDIDASKYRLKAKPTNLFSQDPAQQADQIADFVDRQLLPPDALFDAVQSPDLQSLTSDRKTLERNAVKRVKLIAKGPYTYDLMPQPYHDLAIMKTEAVKMANSIELNDESDEKLDRVVTFLADIDKLLGIGAPPPEPEAAPAPAGPAPGPAVTMPPAPMPANQPQ
jgi:hypothetical protein